MKRLLLAGTALGLAGAFAAGTDLRARRAAAVDSAAAVPPLADAYEIRLESAWPEIRSGGGGACSNGGSETLEGVLARSGDASYSGAFARTTTLEFCGAHGSATRPCRLTLTGSGTVEVRARIREDAAIDPAHGVVMRWTPHGDQAAVSVSGSCPARFGRALARMYRTAAREVELPLETLTGAREVAHLDEYGWVATVTQRGAERLVRAPLDASAR